MEVEKDVLRQLLGRLPVPQEMQRHAEHHGLLLAHDAGKIAHRVRCGVFQKGRLSHHVTVLLSYLYEGRAGGGCKSVGRLRQAGPEGRTGGSKRTRPTLC